ncbi:MAG TPA: ATP-binding protein [Thermoclostridium caenicola]|uniref:histidine kinase n=1 Tax=Thermoclostridium caenicola TaxID=659425 RepID=A0A1M6JY25_9FIRM|nr:ATP-binding protein [Thermoclostridium caenicola]SHJ51541.1 Histidine kinase-, DNA gyrase B-, and HSP90-like ATPase [Thermoclostridium caenicola]HOK42724.1 ATP-binding protein [Thermoclostridium caenicola]HOL84982.1 ATP-binding protein [Thermoclostridium caenicola]HPO77133.1 ATP-binding protein [Thermoclostridium caenicola]
MKDLSLHILDIAQNSVRADADHITVSITVEGRPGILKIVVSDNGKGMEPEFLQKVTDPFTTSRETRHVGLGIPLLKQSAELAGGTFSIRSVVNEGTEVCATFPVDHVDRIPVGNVAETLVMLVESHPEITWEFIFASERDRFEFSLAEVKKALEDVSVTNRYVKEWIQNTLNEGFMSVFGGVLDEVN